MIALQEGVFRTNCIDCLDRTNVVQGLLARKSLMYQFQVSFMKRKCKFSIFCINLTDLYINTATFCYRNLAFWKVESKLRTKRTLNIS